MVNLKQLTDVAKQGAELNCVNQELLPVLILDTPIGIQAIGVTSPDLNDLEAEKQTIVETITQILKKWKATQYVHVHEGYATTFVESAERVNYQIRELPPEDRYDVAVVTAVKKGKPAIGFTAIIDSSNDGTRKIREWEASVAVDGRFVITDW